jgi:hypothetical protein
LELAGGSEWQAIVLSESDFKDASGGVMPAWAGIKELRLAATDRLVSRKDGNEQAVVLGAAWKGPNPKFRDLRWVAPGTGQP